MENLKLLLGNLFKEQILEHAAVFVGKGDNVLCVTYRSADKEIDSETLFDMASVTKILSVTPLALTVLDEKLISLVNNVSKSA